jgi:hypothetical protein
MDYFDKMKLMIQKIVSAMTNDLQSVCIPNRCNMKTYNLRSVCTKTNPVKNSPVWYHPFKKAGLWKNYRTQIKRNVAIGLRFNRK